MLGSGHPHPYEQDHLLFDILVGGHHLDALVLQIPDAPQDLLGVPAEAIQVLDDDDLRPTAGGEVHHLLILAAVISPARGHVGIEAH